MSGCFGDSAEDRFFERQLTNYLEELECECNTMACNCYTEENENE